MDGIDPEIAWYYGRGREIERLPTRCRLEEARTRRIVERRLGGSRRTVVDVGGGPGAYALWLTERGHAVHLVDPFLLHLEQARSAARHAGFRLAGLHVATAEELPFADGAFDAALALGPLYHLTERDRRVRALREMRRVLRPGGILFAAAIGRYGSAIDGFFRGFVADPAFAARMQRTVQDGQHRNPSREDGFFTTAYFHRPEELRAEVAEAGFEPPELLAIEGAWTYIPDLDRKWQDEEFRSLLLDTIERMEADPSVIGFGGHVMAVARRPGPDADDHQR